MMEETISRRGSIDSLDLDVEKVLWKDSPSPEKAYFFGMMEQKQAEYKRKCSQDGSIEKKQSNSATTTTTTTTTTRRRLFYNMDFLVEEEEKANKANEPPNLVSAETPKKQLNWHRNTNTTYGGPKQTSYFNWYFVRFLCSIPVIFSLSVHFAETSSTSLRLERMAHGTLTRLLDNLIPDTVTPIMLHDKMTMECKNPIKKLVNANCRFQSRKKRLEQKLRKERG